MLLSLHAMLSTSAQHWLLGRSTLCFTGLCPHSHLGHREQVWPLQKRLFRYWRQPWFSLLEGNLPSYAWGSEPPSIFGIFLRSCSGQLGPCPGISPPDTEPRAPYGLTTFMANELWSETDKSMIYFRNLLPDKWLKEHKPRQPLGPQEPWFLRTVAGDGICAVAYKVYTDYISTSQGVSHKVPVLTPTLEQPQLVPVPLYRRRNRDVWLAQGHTAGKRQSSIHTQGCHSRASALLSAAILGMPLEHGERSTKCALRKGWVEGGTWATTKKQKKQNNN